MARDITNPLDELAGDPNHGNSGPGGPLPDTDQTLTEDLLRQVLAMEHPAWCDRSRCAVATGEAHLSPPITLSLYDDDANAVVRLELEQPPDCDWPVIVDLKFYDRSYNGADSGVTYEVTLDLTRASRLGHMLAWMARIGDRG